MEHDNISFKNDNLILISIHSTSNPPLYLHQQHDEWAFTGYGGAKYKICIVTCSGHLYKNKLKLWTFLGPIQR